MVCTRSSVGSAISVPAGQLDDIHRLAPCMPYIRCRQHCLCAVSLLKCRTHEILSAPLPPLGSSGDPDQLGPLVVQATGSTAIGWHHTHTAGYATAEVGRRTNTATQLPGY